MYTISTLAEFETNDNLHTFYLDKIKNGTYTIYKDEMPLRKNLVYHTCLMLFVKMAEENASIIKFYSR